MTHSVVASELLVNELCCQHMKMISTGCIKKKFTVGKYSLNERACEICQNFQLACEVQHSLVHVALKLFENLSFPKQEMGN